MGRINVTSSIFAGRSPNINAMIMIMIMMIMIMVMIMIMMMIINDNGNDDDNGNQHARCLGCLLGRSIHWGLRWRSPNDSSMNIATR